MSFNISVTWRGSTTLISLGVADPTLGGLGRAIEDELGASFETLKLLISGKKSQLVPCQKPEQHASEAGLPNGCKALLVASRADEVTQVRASRDLSGMRGFEDELKRAARRRRTASITTITQPPRAEFTFGTYDTWQHPRLHPSPGEALKVLYRLASDPGILGVMESHRYRVGRLTEMPPEGKVGISPMCLLGVNINNGQEISLRLRTDDLKGFRKYERIRETLIHELAHMEYGEHDNNFKTLNSQLGKECAAINSRYMGGHSLLDDAGQIGDGQMQLSELDAAWLHEDNVMAVTARQSGKTLRQLAATSFGVGDRNGVAARPSQIGALPVAASATLFRSLVQQGTAVSLVAQPASAAGAVTDGRDASWENTTTRGAGSDSGGGSAYDGAGNGGDEVRQFEHFDAATEEVEMAARRLGSVDEQQPGSGGDGSGGVRSGLGVEALPGGEGIVHSIPATVEVATAVAVAAVADDPMGVQAPAKVGATGPSTTSTPMEPSSGLGLGTVPEITPERHAPGDLSSATHVMDWQPAVGEPAGAGVQLLGENGAELSETSLRGSSYGATAANPAPPAPPPRLTLQPPRSDDGDGAFAVDRSTDVVLAKVRQTWTALAQMVTASSPRDAPLSGTKTPSASLGAAAPAVTAEDVATAFDTLETLLGNAAHFPSEERYRRVRLGNGAFHRRVGRLPGGLDLLRAAGFTEEGTGPDAALRLRRNDPGLLWLVLSAVKDAREQVVAQLVAADTGRRDDE